MHSTTGQPANVIPRAELRDESLASDVQRNPNSLVLDSKASGVSSQMGTSCQMDSNGPAHRDVTKAKNATNIDGIVRKQPNQHDLQP